MASIFLSYSRDALESTDVLVQDLRSFGHQVWFDQTLAGGQLWWNEILANIRGCDVFVWALTPRALESRACHEEVGYARQLAKPILPVLLSEGINTSKLPRQLRGVQSVDYRNPDKRSAAALMNGIGKLPLPEPLPAPLPSAPMLPLREVSVNEVALEAERLLQAGIEEQGAWTFRINKQTFVSVRTHTSSKAGTIVVATANVPVWDQAKSSALRSLGWEVSHKPTATELGVLGGLVSLLGSGAFRNVPPAVRVAVAVTAGGVSAVGALFHRKKLMDYLRKKDFLTNERAFRTWRVPGDELATIALDIEAGVRYLADERSTVTVERA